MATLLRSFCHKQGVCQSASRSGVNLETALGAEGREKIHQELYGIEVML